VIFVVQGWLPSTLTCFRVGVSLGAMMKALSVRLGILFVGIAATTLGGQSAPQGGDKLDRLIAQMTLDEKIAMLHGATDPERYGQAGYLPGVPRLGVPPLRLTDGPAGVRTSQPATALPAPVALASTFSPVLARQYGQIIGRDGRARHQNVILAPMVNIVRVPQGGRNFETLGEDPFLAGRIVAAEVEGIQGEGLIATVKHFALNNQENQRQSVSADADEQTMHEIELPGFEAAARAGAGAMMAAYNKVNGTYAAESVPLLTTILRGEWGFTGFVMSDWGATHSDVVGLTAGMEMEMPSGRNYAALGEAVKSGKLAESVVNLAVRRILVAMDHAHLLDPAAGQRPAGEIPEVTPIARDIAIAGAVLLKNQGNVLPLSKDDLQSVVVIGPTAKALLVGGGGSARVVPMRTDRPFDMLQRRAGAAAHLTYAVGYDLDGAPVPASALTPEGRTGSQGLLRAQTAGGSDTRVDAGIDFIGANALPAGSAWTWRGTITAPATGDYVIKLHTAGGRGSIAFDAPAGGAGGAGAGAAAPGGRGGGRGGGGGLLPTAEGLSASSTPAHFDAGVARPITITATAGATTPMQIRLAWLAPDSATTRIDEAARAARSARVAVVFAYDEGQEGRDRALITLPGTQDALIQAVVAANPRTVVVLNNGAPILMPWADRAAAILQMWYPGQEGGDATAALLVGDAAPGGKLPVTFPRRIEDAPTNPPERYPGVNGHGAYSEGIFVGYRWYDQQNIEPLFPFGHGLSYTTFTYSDLSAKPAGDGFDVTFTIRNTGTREGIDVPQVYVGPPPSAPAPMALKKLVGFERVALQAGRTQQVTAHISARDLSYWSASDHRWVVAAGKRALVVGASSRDIRLRSEITVTAK
jgi:beta-glucosidase